MCHKAGCHSRPFSAVILRSAMLSRSMICTGRKVVRPVVASFNVAIGKSVTCFIHDHAKETPCCSLPQSSSNCMFHLCTVLQRCKSHRKGSAKDRPKFQLSRDVVIGQFNGFCMFAILKCNKVSIGALIEDRSHLPAKPNGVPKPTAVRSQE
jgi:hypothetical protein